MRYHNITKDDMRNGDGLRVVLWVSGCSHRCEGCQNPVTWDPEDGLVFDEDAKKEIWDALQKDYISGITFTGGDPLHVANKTEVIALMQEIKEAFPDKTIWLYTGDDFESFYREPFLTYVDVCVDGEFILSEMDTKLCWKGSKNQRVIDVQKTLQSGEIVLHCQDYK